MTVGAGDSCRRTLSLPVRVGIPDKVSGLVDDILTPAFATPIGLVLLGLKSNESFSTRKIHIAGAVDKIVSFIKSFLP